MKLITNETVVKSAKVETFTATLTNYRLCVDSISSEESYPIDGITGLAIVDDVEQFAKDKKRANSGIKYMVVGGIFCLSGLISTFQGNSFGTVAFISGAILAVIGIMRQNFKMKSKLTIMQMGNTRQFAFDKLDGNALSLKKLIDEINTEFVLRKQMSNANFNTNANNNNNGSINNNGSDKIAKLKDLKSLLDNGILSQTEFEKEKANVLA